MTAVPAFPDSSHPVGCKQRASQTDQVPISGCDSWMLQTDEQGYYPLQWAALNNRVPCCTYLLEHGAEVGSCS